MLDQSLGWQKSPTTPEQFGGLADKIASLERQIANIESRTVLGTVSAKSVSGQTSGFGIPSNETSLVQVVVPTPNSFSTAVVFASVSGRAVWDVKQGGSGGTGDWRMFYSRLTIEGQTQATGTSYYNGAASRDGNGIETRSYSGISAPIAQVAIPASQINGDINVSASAWTNWASAFHADQDARAALQVVVLFIR
jgi:hypothetical protein